MKRLPKPEDIVPAPVDRADSNASMAGLERLRSGRSVRKQHSTFCPELKNTAFVFIKPHAVTEATKALVTKELASAGIKVRSQGSITAEAIDEKKLIDQHYCTCLILFLH